MGRTMHLHMPTAVLIMEIINHWPDPVIEGDFESRRAAIAHVLEGVGACPNVPMGCPTPSEDGRCPGHEVES